MKRLSSSIVGHIRIAYTGQRHSDALVLYWRSVDLEQGHLTVEGALVRSADHSAAGTAQDGHQPPGGGPRPFDSRGAAPAPIPAGGNAGDDARSLQRPWPGVRRRLLRLDQPRGC